MMRLDLRPNPYSHFHALINPTPFGCADCGEWFQFARELVAHIVRGQCPAATS